MIAMRRRRRAEKRKADDLARLLVALDQLAGEARPMRSRRLTLAVVASR
jgi:hypothetical protein